ncbi:DMT family transporter [Caldinitratiruptor microaerophilus]|uniref:Permease n=1 Tax=Caldinitratiruptor microaerophilus TaxID=671077 RepID=A0AA35G753_9FIRM|nr:DMT family transporter [Caldinitratiruptor microaerophilus]BDG62296.1 permease [Caldinitratiruptor microaerophilus]
MPPTILRGSLAVLLAAALFGISGAVARLVFRDAALPPMVLVALRMTLSFAGLLPALALANRNLLRVPRGQWLPLLLWGAGPMLLVQYTYFLAIAETNVATAIFLEYLAPVLSALYGWAFRQERPGPALLAGIVLSVGGAGLLVLGGEQGMTLSPLGLAYGIGAAFAMAWYSVWGGRFEGRVGPWAQLVWGMGGAALAAQFVTPPWVLAPYLADRSLWPFYAFLAVLASSVPFGLYIYGVRALPATVAMIIATAEPVVAAVVAWFLLGEGLRWLQLVGAGAIVAAVITVQVSAARRNQEHPGRAEAGPVEARPAR